jgi:hypothetical protein
MGNCAGYCISETNENKQKVTVEQGFYAKGFNSEQKQTDANNANEFEIEYGTHQNKLKSAREGGKDLNHKRGDEDS